LLYYIFYDGYFSAQTFAYRTNAFRHIEPNSTSLIASSVHFGCKPRLRFTELDESKSLRFRTKPNQTEPGPSKSRL